MPGSRASQAAASAAGVVHEHLVFGDAVGQREQVPELLKAILHLTDSGACEEWHDSIAEGFETLIENRLAA